MCLLPRRSTATIRPFRCWSPVSAEPGPGDYGCMSATTGRSVVPHRRRRSTFTAPTAAASIQRPISRTSRAFCKPMPIAGSRRCTSRGRPVQGSLPYRRSPRSPAGAIAAEKSSTCGKRRSRPSPKRRSTRSPSSTPLRTRPASPRPPSGWSIAPLSSPCSMRSSPGRRLPSESFRHDRNSLRPCATS